jgi:hypothetical protein
MVRCGGPFAPEMGLFFVRVPDVVLDEGRVIILVWFSAVVSGEGIVSSSETGLGQVV